MPKYLLQKEHDHAIKSKICNQHHIYQPYNLLSHFPPISKVPNIEVSQRKTQQILVDHQVKYLNQNQ